MTTSIFQKTALAIAGLTASAIGGFILFAPQAFYAGYGILLPQDPNLLSELRAPAANLTILGLVMLAGLFRSAWAGVSATVVIILFYAFAFGRLVSIAMDGMPSDSIVVALIIELAIATICLVAFWPGSQRQLALNS